MRSSVRIHDLDRTPIVEATLRVTGFEMAMSCFLCEQRSEDAQEIPSDV